VQQEGELIPLRSAQESLQKEFGADTTVAQVAAKIRTLSASVTGLEAQARMEEIYREVLGKPSAHPTRSKSSKRFVSCATLPSRVRVKWSVCAGRMSASVPASVRT
jgi:hypothetical protein